MALSNLLDKTVIVTLAGGGSPDSGAPVPCTIAPADWRTVQEYAQQGVTAVWLVYSSISLEVASGDHLTIDGKTYPVVAVRSFNNAAVGPPVFVTVCGAAA